MAKPIQISPPPTVGQLINVGGHIRVVTAILDSTPHTALCLIARAP